MTLFWVNQGLILYKNVFKILRQISTAQTPSALLSAILFNFYQLQFYHLPDKASLWRLDSFFLFKFTIAGSGSLRSFMSICISFVPFLVFSTSLPSINLLRRSFVQILMLEDCPANSDLNNDKIMSLHWKYCGQKYHYQDEEESKFTTLSSQLFLLNYQQFFYVDCIKPFCR